MNSKLCAAISNNQKKFLVQYDKQLNIRFVDTSIFHTIIQCIKEKDQQDSLNDVAARIIISWFLFALDSKKETSIRSSERIHQIFLYKTMQLTEVQKQEWFYRFPWLMYTFLVTKPSVLIKNEHCIEQLKQFNVSGKSLYVLSPVERLVTSIIGSLEEETLNNTLENNIASIIHAGYDYNEIKNLQEKDRTTYRVITSLLSGLKSGDNRVTWIDFFPWVCYLLCVWHMELFHVKRRKWKLTNNNFHKYIRF